MKRRRKIEGRKRNEGTMKEKKKKNQRVIRCDRKKKEQGQRKGDDATKRYKRIKGRKTME